VNYVDVGHAAGIFPQLVDNLPQSSQTSLTHVRGQPVGFMDLKASVLEHDYD